MTRKVLACLLIAAVIPASMGIVIIPVSTAGRTAVTPADEDFPCKAMNCGCTDAAACSDNCCCGLTGQVTSHDSMLKSDDPQDQEPSVRLEIRSACCSTQGNWQSLGFVDWQVFSGPQMSVELPLVSIEEALSSEAPDAPSLTVIPTPPRRGCTA